SSPEGPAATSSRNGKGNRACITAFLPVPRPVELPTTRSEEDTVPKRANSQPAAEAPVTTEKSMTGSGRSGRRGSGIGDGGGTGAGKPPVGGLPELLEALRALEAGDFSVRVNLDGDP